MVKISTSIAGLSLQKSEMTDGMQKTDVLIVGAGPAGSVCGYLLQKAGVSCLLIDHATFPRDKICGGGVTPKGWTLLEKLMPGFKYDYNSIRKIKLIVEDNHHCEFDSALELRLVQRKVFDRLLLEQYLSAGGTFQKDAFLQYEEFDDHLVVTLKSGEKIACRYLVGADGSTSAVRRQLTGERDNGILFVEQYVEKSSDNAIEISMSKHYDVNGYFYRFPNKEFDAVGYGDVSMNIEKGKRILHEKQIPEGKLRGCYLYLKNDYPLNDRVILIGDAGGFAHRITCEGIRPAIETAVNAAEAIKTGRPFREVNALIFEKMKKQDKVLHYFYKPANIWLLGQLCRWPSVVKWCFDRALRPK